MLLESGPGYRLSGLLLFSQLGCDRGNDWTRQKADGACSGLITPRTRLVSWLVWGQGIERQADRWGNFYHTDPACPPRGLLLVKPNVCVRASDRCNGGLCLPKFAPLAMLWPVGAQALLHSILPISVRLELVFEVLGEVHF